MASYADSPSHFFTESIYGDGDPYTEPFDLHDKGAVYDPKRLKLCNDKLFVGDSPFSRGPKSQVPRSSLWDRMETSEAEAGSGNLPLFVDPSLYSNNGAMGLPMHVDDSPSPMAEESQPSTRRPSTVKSEFHEASKSASSSTDMTPPDPPPQKKRKPRKTKRATNVPKDEERRVKFLERNRIAASKCREKKKLFVSDLEETKIDLEARHAQLQLEYNGLLSEVSGLKHRLMAHAKCGDPNIDSWLSNEARRFVQTSHDLFGTYQGPPLHVSHNRNHSTASSRQSVSYNPLDDRRDSFNPLDAGDRRDSFNPLDAGDRRDSIAFSQGKQAPGS